MKESSFEEKYRLGSVLTALIIFALSVILLAQLEWQFLPLLPKEDPDGFLEKTFFSISVIALAWLLLYHLGRGFERLIFPKVGSHAHARSMWKLISYILWLFVFLFIILASIGHIDPASITLSIGIFGAALAFVLQKPLQNLAGWVVITYRRIYRIGDRVALGGVKGYVTDIQIMHTQMREFGEWMRGDTFTGRIITVPNGVVFDQPVYNYTRDFPFVWDEIVNLVTYESDIEIAKKYMLESAREVVGDLMKENYEKYKRKVEIKDLHTLLPREPELRMELADSGVNIYVVYFCPVETRRKIKAEITERIWNRFMKDPKVGIAYPHMHLVGGLDK